jgi:hypothetical protein
VSEGQEPGRVFAGRTIAKPSAKRDLRKGPTGGMLGDVVEQTDVARAVEDMRTAIRAGEMVHARVLSGVGVGTPKDTVPFDPPETKPRTVTLDTFGEHSILIIGFEGDTFVFHDPDASSSSTPERGFGFLVHDLTERRLSTAFIDNDFPVDGDGDHRRGDHRYQVTQLNQI